jgi:alkylation response protein AidB-like acyl-CoA dehydrogenase
MESVEAFRRRARSWVVAHLEPAEVADDRELDDDNELGVRFEQARETQRAIFDAGLAGIRYPEQYGGLGLTRDHQLAWREAAKGYSVPRVFNVTQGVLGATLLQFGTETQKRRHIPAMLDGTEIWVQFLSEPSGGSDLAGLLTRASADGNAFLINGSKIWSTGAQFADYSLILVRTDFDQPKHHGLSMLILPIRSEGVTVRPIRLVTGGAHFCQEFFDDVRVPTENLVGQQNDGWSVASGLLFHERSMVGGTGLNDNDFGHRGGSRHADDIIELAHALDLDNDAHIRQLIGEAVILERLVPLTTERVNTLIKDGNVPPAAAAILKLMDAVTQYRQKEIALEIGGTRATMLPADDPIGRHGNRWLGARIECLGGGSNEIQRNVISERVLGLPREAAPDRDVPFRDVLANRRR